MCMYVYMYISLYIYIYIYYWIATGLLQRMQYVLSTHTYTHAHMHTHKNHINHTHTHNNRLCAFFPVCSTYPSSISHPWDRHIPQTHPIHICAHSHTHELVWMQASLCCAKEPYKRDDILQKRPVISSIILTVATPYWIHVIARSEKRTNTHIQRSQGLTTDMNEPCHIFEWACNLYMPMHSQFNKAT